MKTRVRPEIAAEAAIWIARLHGPDRSAQMERECLAWQATSPEHRLAFERCTDTWLDAAGLGRTGHAQATPPIATTTSSSRPATGKWRPVTWRWAWMAAPAALAATMVALLLHWPHGDTYRTQPGEQLTVALQDGSRVTLNTATQVKVDFSETQRTVNVDAGEALFEVAKDPRRRFVVRVADTEVIAKGTVFAVRYTPAVQAAKELVVSLLEGQVDVRSAAIGPQPASMVAGDRVRLLRPTAAEEVGRDATAVQRDRPNLDHVLAWNRGEAFFENTSLQDAVDEMNRYSRTPITLSNPDSIGQLRVSGTYRTGDNLSFARAIAALHQLTLSERGGQLELASRQNSIAP